VWTSVLGLDPRPPKKIRKKKKKKEKRSLLALTLFVSWKELTPGRRAESSTKQLVSVMSAFWTQRSAILFSILVVLRPGVPFRTTKALTCPLSELRAHTTITSACRERRTRTGQRHARCSSIGAPCKANPRSSIPNQLTRPTSTQCASLNAFKAPACTSVGKGRENILIIKDVEHQALNNPPPPKKQQQKNAVYR
jgi:hypothetical protein